jgi:hypothetical protein
MERRIEGVLERIREKLDRNDPTKKENPEEAIKSIDKMINSLDKLIYDPNYFGKNIPEIGKIAELKRMLKDMVDSGSHSDMERIKRMIDRMLSTRRAKLRVKLGQ